MPFDYAAVTAESVASVTDEGIAAAGALADRVAAAAPGDDVLTLLDQIGATLGDSYGRGAFMGRAAVDAAVREAGVAAEEKISKWAEDLVFRDDLYAAVKAYRETADAAALTGERRRLLDFWMRDFRRAGHELSPEDRAEVQGLKQRLIELTVEFQRNIDEHKDGLDLTAEQLDGLPPEFIEGLDAGEAEGTHRVSLDYPEYYPFMRLAVDRDLREQLQHKNWNRAITENRPLLEEAVVIRARIAKLLGYPTWAHHGMEVKMAKEPEAVRTFFDEIQPGLTKKGSEELDTIRALLAAETPGAELRSSDVAYLDNLQRKRDFGVDPEEVAKYFPLEQVIDGMFAITGEVFGLDYRRIDDAKPWHEDAALYEIVDRASGRAIARFYMDLFPREGKFGHAAAFDLVKGRREPDGSYTRPVAAVLANFTKPAADRPSLLKHDEVLTLFHEFGHVLHMCVTTAETHRFAGADTEWDFVEAPSQIMEHWCWNVGVLQRFARHHETGEPIPVDVVDQLVAARDLNIGILTLRQMYFGELDLGLHAVAEAPQDLDAVNRKAYEVTLLPFHEGTFFPAGFGHIMGGYDAGYYGYLWAKVYGDDMFSVFEDEGITSPTVGHRYRDELLAPGGSRDAADLLRAFLGREPNNEAFLRHLGLG